MDEKLYSMSISKVIVNEKPDKNDPNTKKLIGKIKNNMEQCQLTLFQFNDFILKKYNWCGGIFNNNKVDKESWIESSIIGMDFDKGEMTVEDVFKKFEEFQIVPNLCYRTLGDSPQLMKFRIVLLFDQPITDHIIYEKIMKTLEKIFPIDIQCKDVSRFFFGGKESNIINRNPISLVSFLDFININIVSLDNNLTRSIINYEIDFNFNINNSDSANFPVILYNNYRNNGFLAKNKKNITTSLQGGTRINWKTARKRIKILDEFVKGRRIHHHQIFGLATNMQYIEGGLKLMKETMQNYNEKGSRTYTDNSFAVLPYVKKMRYHQVPVFKFSDYNEDSCLYDIISEVLNQRGRIKIIQQRKKNTLESAEIEFDRKFAEAIQCEDLDKVYIFSLPTAIGKTQKLTSVENSIIALPTNNLKNEVKNRMEVKNLSTPDSFEFSTSYLNSKIEYFYKIGLPQKAMGIIRSVSEGRRTTNENDISLAENYITQLEACGSTNETVLTTHKRVLNTDLLTHKTVVFDEDPLSSLVEIKKTSIKEFSGLQYLFPELKEVVDFLKPLENNIYQTKRFAFDIEELIDDCKDITIFESNVFDFFISQYFFYYDGVITYVVKKELPRGKKSIIMSATIPIEIYRKLYPEIIFEIVDIKDVEQKGNVIQYTNRSCSRDGLLRYGNQISQEIEDKPVITFKSFKNIFQNSPEEIHFGNCSGYDTFKGRDIAVVGTPHRSNIEYFLFAKLIGINFDINNSPMNYQKIQYNGFEFMFNCFDNLDLRMIQLSLIESDLIQAVGRGRTLRNDNTVELYSSFPLSVTTEFKIKKTA